MFASRGYICLVRRFGICRSFSGASITCKIVAFCSIVLILRPSFVCFCRCFSGAVHVLCWCVMCCLLCDVCCLLRVVRRALRCDGQPTRRARRSCARLWRTRGPTAITFQPRWETFHFPLDVSLLRADASFSCFYSNPFVPTVCAACDVLIMPTKRRQPLGGMLDWEVGDATTFEKHAI